MNSDDVVFLIFIYQVRHVLIYECGRSRGLLWQRWIYRVDPKRVNEYGQVLVADDDTNGVNGESKKDR
jgi:hypothetical protein